MSKTNKNVIPAIAVLSAVALASAGIGALIADDTSKVNELNDKIAELSSAEPIVKFVNVTQEVPVNHTVIKTVEVDNGKLAMVTQYLEDADIFEDAEDVVAEIEQEDAAKQIAFEEIKKVIADELEDNDFVKDEDDVKLVKIYTDFDDIDIVRADFDDNEYKFIITVKVEDTRLDKKFKVDVTVKVDGEDVDVSKVQEH